MSVLAGTLAMGRSAAENRMRATVTVGPYTEGTDPETLEATRTFGTPVYADKARVKYPTLNVSERVAASQQIATTDVELHIPVGTGPGIAVGHLVRVTADLDDPSMVGREYRVAGPAQGGQVTARRFPVVELS